MKNTTGLRWVHVYRDRLGRVKFYVRRSGHPTMALPGRPGSAEFSAAYAAAVASITLKRQQTKKAVAERPRPRQQRGPVVYFAKAGDFIKIGFSTRVSHRLRQLSTASAVRPEIILTIPGSRETEGQLHERFAAARANGEWFHAVPSLMDFIADLRTKSEQDLANLDEGCEIAVV